MFSSLYSLNKCYLEILLATSPARMRTIPSCVSEVLPARTRKIPASSPLLPLLPAPAPHRLWLPQVVSCRLPTPAAAPATHRWRHHVAAIWWCPLLTPHCPGIRQMGGVGVGGAAVAGQRGATRPATVSSFTQWCRCCIEPETRRVIFVCVYPVV